MTELSINQKLGLDLDPDLTEVFGLLKTYFGWGNIASLPNSYIYLLNDTVKATKRIIEEKEKVS